VAAVKRRTVFGFIIPALIFICLGLHATETPIPPGCQHAVKAFFARPNRSTVAGLSEADEARCWAIIDSSNSNFDRLTRWVEQGNQWAAEYLAKHLKRLDGGNLEDAFVALGNFSVHNMEEFLMCLNSTPEASTTFSLIIRNRFAE
jgi:hypothetical protein